MKERGPIGNAILETLKRAKPKSEQESQTLLLNNFLNFLIRGGFQDLRLEDQEVVFNHSAFTYSSQEFSFVRVADGRRVHLTPSENDALKLLAQSFGKVVRHSEFARTEEGSRELMHRLRRKVEPDARKGTYRYLVVRNGEGYKMVDPDKPEFPDSPAIFDSETHLQLHSKN